MSVDKIQKIIPNKIYSTKLERLANFKPHIFNNNLNNLIKKKFDTDIPSLSGISSPKITEEILLEIYKINSIDDLRVCIIDIIKNNKIIYYDNIKKGEYVTNPESNNNFIPFSNIHRILNAWIYVNFTDLKTHNNNLIELLYNTIIKMIIDKSLYNNQDLYKHIKDFVKYWFTKHDKTEFSLDLLTDIKKYINSIY